MTIGENVVIGTHSHCAEPIEYTISEETDHEMLTYYSLGNFVNWTSGTGQGVGMRIVGAMVKVKISKDDEGKALKNMLNKLYVKLQIKYLVI